VKAGAHAGRSTTSPASWTVLAIILIAFALLAASGRNGSLFLQLNALGPATSDVLWANITALGDTVAALALCLPLWRRRPDLVWALAIGGVLATAWVHGLKPWLDIARPPAVLGDAVHVIGPAFTTHSFPSGHATTAFLVAGLLACGIGSRLVFAAALLIASTVAVSRAVVGVHWPLDLLGGACGGWLAAQAGLALAQRFPAAACSRPVQWLLGSILTGCAVALLAGYDGGYPQAAWFLRTLAVAVLAAAGAALWRQHEG
jgi:membrane-associated phospholipid phosphatase